MIFFLPLPSVSHFFFVVAVSVGLLLLTFWTRLYNADARWSLRTTTAVQTLRHGLSRSLRIITSGISWPAKNKFHNFTPRQSLSLAVLFAHCTSPLKIFRHYGSRVLDNGSLSTRQRQQQQEPRKPKDISWLAHPGSEQEDDSASSLYPAEWIFCAGDSRWNRDKSGN